MIKEIVIKKWILFLIFIVISFFVYTFFLNPGHPNKVRFIFKKGNGENRVNLKFNYSKLHIDTDPEGADVFLNGSKAGKTPLRHNFLNEGIYEVEVKKSYHLKEKRNLLLKKNEKKVLHIPLIRGRGSLEIDTDPKGAAIIIDGVKHNGKTPVFFSQYPSGRYRVKISMKGYHKIEKFISLNPGENKEKKFRLKKILPGFLYIDNLPDKSRVSVLKMDIPFKQGMKLMPGVYAVKLSSPYSGGNIIKARIYENRATRLNPMPEKGGRLIVDTGLDGVKLWLVNKKAEYKNNSLLKSGKYRVGVFKKGYGDFFFDLEIEPGRVVRKKIELVPKGRLFVKTDPKDSEVNIIGVWDKFHQGIYLPHGEYRLEIKNPKFPLANKIIRIEKGKDTKVKVNLNFYEEPFTKMKFTYVPEGCFDMGCFQESGCPGDELPVHNVCVDGFWMGIYEVNQGQWKKIMKKNPSGFKNGDGFPVEKVSWKDSIRFIKKLNEINKDGYSFRLPTESEWEYAARSRGISEKFSGGRDAENLGWYSKNTGYPMAGGQKQANYLGIYDMSGNVWEWCLDSYDPKAYSLHLRKNPVMINNSSLKVFRGGGWYSGEEKLSVTNRSSLYSGNFDTGIGFRLVRVKNIHMDKLR